MAVLGAPAPDWAGFGRWEELPFLGPVATWVFLVVVIRFGEEVGWPSTRICLGHAFESADFTDVVRAYTPGPGVYTYWDYTQLHPTVVPSEAVPNGGRQ